MLRVIEFIFSLVSLVILASSWTFFCSNISFYVHKLLIRRGLRQKVQVYSLFTGLIFEIILASISLVVIAALPEFNYSINFPILSGLEKGRNLSVLLSPVSSILGAAIGTKIRKPLWKYF